MTTRRQRTVNTLAVFLLVFTGTLFSQSTAFWEKKPYMQWTGEELTRMTTNSPWAKELSIPSGTRPIKLSIRWLTALPIKEALLKDRMSAGGALADSAKEIMSVTEMYYAIGISGLPAELAPMLTEATLEIPNKPSMMPVHGEFENSGRFVEVTALFARTTPITATDNAVDVVLKIGEKEYRTTFALKDMMYNGKLEL